MIMNLNLFIIRLEIENARLEATANKQSKEINTLQKGTHEAALVSLIFLGWLTVYHECFQFNGSCSCPIHHINVTTFSIQISISKACSKVFCNESWFCHVIVKARDSRISPRKHRFLP